MPVTDPDILSMVPPAEIWSRVGSATDFVEGGAAFCDYMIEKAELTPQSSVLDVGCGLGKHAIHFAKFLQPPGEYEGFDVEDDSIEWCKKAITPRYPHIRFQSVNVRSSMYSPENTVEAGDFRFPYDDGRFDFVFLGSVFSHMFFPDVRNYASEIVRVLKPGGRMLGTGYWLDDSKRQAIAAGTAAFRFAHPYQGSYIEAMELLEGAVAQEQDELEAMFAEVGMPVEYIRTGGWATLNVQDQDFAMTRKPL